MRKLTYYVAVTLDGFIADPDGRFDFFPIDEVYVRALFAEFPETAPVHIRQAMGIEVANRSFDTVVMGRRTFEPALDAGLTSAYPHLEQVVYSRTLDPVPDPTVTVIDVDPLAHVKELKQRAGLGIWLCGGGILAGALLPEIDELILKVNPMVIGTGRPLFDRPFTPNAFTLVANQVHGNGVAVLRYQR